MGFGDSSLNFELRCFINEVEKRLVTLGDLNYAIEKELHRAGIEIPFPQRDIHLRGTAVDLGRQPDGTRSADTHDDRDK